MRDVLILGCGFTGRRVAERFLGRGAHVAATARDTAPLAELASRGVVVHAMDALNPESVGAIRHLVSRGMLVLHSIPVIDGPMDPTPRLLEALDELPSRIVYLSTTAVYGGAREVDHRTPPAPSNERAVLRLEAEQHVAAGAWSSLILRPAAIYGPGRGVHESMRLGRFRLLDGGGNMVSRIHVEDLAAIVEAALLSRVTGAYPVADAEPCSSREIAEYCAALLGLPMPPSEAREPGVETRGVDRRVNGEAIRRLLGVSLRYPSYRTGIAAELT